MRGAKRRSAKRTHVWFGLGIDRLTMEVLGLANVREAVLFPRDRTRLAP